MARTENTIDPYKDHMKPVGFFFKRINLKI